MGITPQFLARLGEDGPKLRIGESGTWYREETYHEAVSKGEETESPSMKGSFHAGKIGLMNQSWAGSLELKASGLQQGINRKLLEKKLTKSLSTI